MKRYLENQVKKDLAKKMVFIGGPRQVGKTTISKNLSSKNFTYLNWDSNVDREIILKQEFPDTKLLIFDEIHSDWTLVPTMPARFENLVAMHLLKWINFEEDTKGRDLGLGYFKDQEKREVDFIVTENRRPIIAVECKWSDAEISPHLKYFKNKFPEIDAYQLSAIGKKDYVNESKIKVMPAIKFLKNLI